MDETGPARPVDIAALTAPFPREAVKTRSDRGKDFSYIQGHSVINRLNAATGNRWTFEVIETQTRDIAIAARDNRAARTDLLVTARVRLTLPGLGAREHVGVQMVSPGSGEDLVKGAITDALKKAATLFGVGIELYGPDYEDDGEQVDRRTGEIAAPSRPAPSPPAEAAPKRSPRDEAAVTLADFAKSKGVTREMLQVLAVEKIDKTLERCDLADLLKLLNFLKTEKDMDQLKDFLRSDPPPIGQQSSLMDRPEPTPLRSAPDRYTS